MSNIQERRGTRGVLPHKEALEPTVTDAIQNLWTKEEIPPFSDVKLQGTDGEPIAVHRTILAARSDIFKTLFYGSFKEASNSVIALGYEESILRAIVEYCYTDKVSSMLNNSPLTAGQIPGILELAAAADYFHFPKLYDNVIEWLSEKMGKDMALVLPSLISSEGRNTKIFKYAKNIIRSHFTIWLERSSSDLLASVESSLIKQIVSDQRVVASEIKLFQFIQTWFEAPFQIRTETNPSKRPRLEHDCASDCASEKETRREEASSLVAKCVKLKYVSPADICTVVEPSGLVENKCLFEAYKAHAIGLQDTNGNFRNQRGVFNGRMPISESRWRHLECNLIRSGLHRWSLEVGKENRGAVSFDLCSRRGENAPVHWVYNQSGKTATITEGGQRQKGRIPAPSFGPGTSIEFTLDLTERGSLRAIVFNEERENTRAGLVFNNMLMHDGEKIERSFSVSVCVQGRDQVRFLGFQETDDNITAYKN